MRGGGGGVRSVVRFWSYPVQLVIGPPWTGLRKWIWCSRCRLDLENLTRWWARTNLDRPESYHRYPLSRQFLSQRFHIDRKKCQDFHFTLYSHKDIFTPPSARCEGWRDWFVHWGFSRPFISCHWEVMKNLLHNEVSLWIGWTKIHFNSFGQFGRNAISSPVWMGLNWLLFACLFCSCAKICSTGSRTRKTRTSPTRWRWACIVVRVRTGSGKAGIMSQPFAVRESQGKWWPFLTSTLTTYLTL